MSQHKSTKKSKKDITKKQLFDKLTANQKTFYNVLVKSLGNVSAAVRTTGLDRSNHYKWCKTNDSYKQLVDQIADIELDYYEQALRELIQKSNPAAIIFALKAKGKHRGWIEKQEIEHSGNVTKIEVEHVGENKKTSSK